MTTSSNKDKGVKECKHCGGDIAIRNPKGNCDHLYYPENCKVCMTTSSKTRQPFFATLKEAKEACKSYYDNGGQLRDCTCGTCPTTSSKTNKEVEKIAKEIVGKWGIEIWEKGWLE